MVSGMTDSSGPAGSISPRFSQLVLPSSTAGSEMAAAVPRINM